MEKIEEFYNGYKGVAYGRSSFSVYNSEGREIFHTGFCRHMPKTQDECLEELKRTLHLLDVLRSYEHE